MDIKIDLSKVLEAVEDGLGHGPLTLGIFCCKCGAQFELNSEAVTMAIALETTFLEYLRFVQMSPCKSCGCEAIDEKL